MHGSIATAAACSQPAAPPTFLRLLEVHVSSERCSETREGNMTLKDKAGEKEGRTARRHPLQMLPMKHAKLSLGLELATTMDVKTCLQIASRV